MDLVFFGLNFAYNKNDDTQLGVKTEKEFSDYFIKSCPHSTTDQDLVKQISLCYWSDLTTHLTGYFEFNERLVITQKAGHLLSQNLTQYPNEQAWVSVIRDFVEHNSWGQVQVSKKPVAKKTEEQKIFWELFKYCWAFFQSMVILKTAVYFFGLESAQHPDDISKNWVWLFFSLSASSLVFFAYRNRNKND